MHLAIPPRDRAVALEYHGGVVIQPCGATLKKRAYQHDAKSLRYLAPQPQIAIEVLRIVEIFGIFALAKIMRLMKLLQND